MVAFCAEQDVKDRLSRDLTSTEKTYLPGKIKEAQLLVVSYLGCGPDPYKAVEDVPDAVTVVTSRMVARVLQEADTPQEFFGATQVGENAGPFSQQVTFQAGSRIGSPWLAKADRETLDPYRCSGKAFSIDTAPTGGTAHAEGCSAINYQGLPGSYWPAYCTCGADLAGFPIFGVRDEE